MATLAKSYSRAAIVAELGVHTGDIGYFDESLSLHSKGLELIRELVRRHPADAQIRRTLADAMVTKAAAHVLAARELDRAIADCREALTIHEALAAADPSNVEAQQDLSYAHYTIGRAHQLQQERSAAADHFRKSISILEPLIAANPQNNETRFDLQRSHRGLAETAAN